ncbi:hypothetical protein Leryth_021780 [Lithospermum erythrorhizon]|nr:hypothetical protein Leryth_021780 [Lithospermum erythrorhizon]
MKLATILSFFQKSNLTWHPLQAPAHPLTPYHPLQAPTPTALQIRTGIPTDPPPLTPTKSPPPLEVHGFQVETPSGVAFEGYGFTFEIIGLPGPRKEKEWPLLLIV